MAALPRHDGVRYAGLVMNRRGLDRALAGGVDEIDVVVVATDTFCQRNQGMSTAEACDTRSRAGPGARAAGVFSTITIGASFGCPFEGEVPPDRLREVVRRVRGRRPRRGGPGRHHRGRRAVRRHRAARAGPRAGRRRPSAAAAPPRHPAHRGRQRGRGGRGGRRRPWTPASAAPAAVPFAPERDRQRRHRGPRLPLRPHGHRHRPRPGQITDGGVARGAVGQAAPGALLRAGGFSG